MIKMQDDDDDDTNTDNDHSNDDEKMITMTNKLTKKMDSP